MMQTKTNTLTTFTFNTERRVTTATSEVSFHDIRVVEIDGEPWFVAKDVCEALGLTNPSIATARLDDDERAKFNLGQRGLGSVLIVSESGLYDLIMQSRKPEAEAFKRWVRKEVLPAIRKDGAYVMGEEKVAAGEMSEEEFVLKAIDILQRKVERLKQEVEDKEKTIGGLKTTIGKHDHTLARFIRTLPGVNAMKIKSDLLDLGYLYRRGGAYRVYRQFDALFTEKFDDRYGHVEIMVTKEGKQKIADLYMAGLLTMKKGCVPASAGWEVA